MPTLLRFHSLVTFLLVCSTGTAWPVPPESSGSDAAAASGAAHESQPAHPAAAAPKPPLDRSGRKRVGKASVYAKKFAGKKMADGATMQSQGDNAASKTLPLGTKAKVTNLETGKSAVVTIQDRGPYVKGRIIDLSPATAQKIGIEREEGVSKVEVNPITVPQSDGSTKQGAAGTEPKKN